MTSRLTLARPREAPILKLLGWEEIGPWSQSFILMQLTEEPPDTSLIVDIRKIAGSINQQEVS